MLTQIRSAFVCLAFAATVLELTLNLAFTAEFIQLTEKNFDALCPRGKEVDAIYGDWVLRNEHVVAVIAAPRPGRNANMTVRGVGGMLIDYTARSAQADQLSCFYPAGSRYVFEDVNTATLVVDGREMAVSSQPQFEGRNLKLTLRGKPASGQDSQASVTYMLADGDIALAYRVELVNVSDKPQDLSVTDLVRCDGATFKFGNDDSLRLLWAEDRFFHQAYGLLPDAGKFLRAKDGRSLTLVPDSVTPAPSAQIAPSQSRVWGGRILCSQGLPGLRRMALALAGNTPTQSYQLKLNAADGEVFAAEVEFFSQDQSLGIVHTDRDGWLRMRLTPGEYSAKIVALAREPREHKFTVANAPLAESLTLAAATRLRGKITDQDGRPIAAKIQIVGQEGTESPNFGPDASDYGVRNLIYTADGNVSQALPAGKYTVMVSHGPEYDAVTQPLEILNGQVATLNSSLHRTVNSQGWVSGEFHSHSSPSGDNTSSQLGRVLNLLAEHLEFAPCTEHNRVDSYSEHLTALKATQMMATCTGIECTGSPLPVNHQNAFPLHRHVHTQDGGGPASDADPVVQIERLAMWDNNSDKVVQINHPNIPQILGDRDTDGTADQGFRRMFDIMDVIEVHPPEAIFTPPSAEGSPRDRKNNPIFHWMQLLNLGYQVPGVVNTDAHYNWHGSGWLRNYIASTTDDPASIKTEDMVRAIQAGQLIMTTAPFLEAQVRADIEGQSRRFISGDYVPLGKNSAKLWIRVQCANWYDINRVQVFANGRPLPEFNFSRGSHPQYFQSSNVRFEAELALPQFKEDTHVIVAAIGEGLKLGLVMGPDRGQLPPVAVANPIYVDVDGGKFKPNGDNLGVPFMLLGNSANSSAPTSKK